jgi:hypothetical protein
MDAATDRATTNPQAGAESPPPAATPSFELPPQTGPRPKANGAPARETMSRFERLSLIISIISLVISAFGFTAVLISLWDTREQMRYLAAQTKIVSRDRSLANVLALNKVFLDHPELRPYFYAGKDLDEADPLYPKVEAVADMHLDVYGYNLDYRLVFPDDYRKPEDYKVYIRQMLALSPVMQRRLAKKGEWFSPYLQEVLKEFEASKKKAG